MGALFRAKNVSPSISLFAFEVNNLRDIFFKKNGYPNNSKITFEIFRTNQSIRCQCWVDSSQCWCECLHQWRCRKKCYFENYFCGEISNVCKIKMILLFQEKFNIKLKPVLTTIKVGAYFSLRSKIQMHVRPNVINHFTCLRDASIDYIEKNRGIFGESRTH